MLDMPSPIISQPQADSLTPVPTHLVRHVEDDAVVGGVEHVVERHRQLDHAERGAQVPARLGDVAERVPTQLVRELLQLLILLLLNVWVCGRSLG